MLPFDEGTKAKRNINLGGTKSQFSHADLLGRARALRNSRRDERNREEAAQKIQTWFRSQKEIQNVRNEMKIQFDRGPGGEQVGIMLLHTAEMFIRWTRLLLFSGTDEFRLNKWAREMLSRKHDILLGLFGGPLRHSWLSLIKRIALPTLISYTISASQTLTHLQVVDALLSSFEAGSEDCHSQQIALLTQYLIRRSLESMPVSIKAPLEHAGYYARIIATILNITSLSTQNQPQPEFLNPTLPFTQFLSSITIIPLLPNRIPIKVLPYFASRIPWNTPVPLNQFTSSIPEVSRPHVLANLVAFVPPHYSKFPPIVISFYLQAYSVLLDSIDYKVLEGRNNNKQITGSNTDKEKHVILHDDVDTEDEDVDLNQRIPSAGTPAHNDSLVESSNVLDSRTLNRLSTLAKPSHLNALLSVTSYSSNARGDFFKFAISLTLSFPTRRSQLWSDISVSPHGGSGLIRECWRGYVRSSPLGKLSDDGAIKTLMVGDDEFFSLSASSTVMPRNPLSIDDLIVFSRQLLNIAFPLYWLDDQTKIKSSGPQGIHLAWEKIREWITSCLKGIHARDSRRRFTPPDHWHVTSQLNMHSFVEAAILEEQTLFNGEQLPDATTGTSITVSRHRLSPRQLAQLSPRLGVLNNIPFAIPFEVRVEIFRQFVRNDYERTVSNSSSGNVFDRFFNRPRRKRAVVRRGSISRDGFDQLSGLGPELKGPVEIQFIDQFGQEEAGIDGGGVFKEFLTSLSKEVFDTNRGLWLTTKQQELYPNPHSYATEQHQLDWYKFIGHILGKALYDGILVDVVFAPFFLAKWLGKQSYLDDLASLDPELYNGLVFLKHYDKNFEDLSLNFTVSEDVSHYRLNRQIRRQSQAFFDGLSDIIDPKWLRMFNQQELQILIGGINAPIDVDDLRANCNYGGVYDENDETIQLFWKVLESFNQEQRRGLLRFVTSCSRPPLLGFKELNPKFCIRDSSNDEQRLPSSSTCVNLLKLPRYKTQRGMQTKLLQAINSGAGFDLS
ncbi:hypothetical protein Clacol_007497 [Clathrus columnatus]|uniref:HECT-type E3 ubiquitin transferase n=1 Tax=Clathrus columnatus TaxID=1419009 RepID=A0AAV5AF29_9AGAM|nr:hypothetical protein Clacol_007497 [Clathrus columnatus]